MGWLERGSGRPGQLHSPMFTGEDWYLPIVGTIFGTIKDVAVDPKTREYRGQRTLQKNFFGRASHGESDPVSSPIDVLKHICQCRLLKEQRF